MTATLERPVEREAFHPHIGCNFTVGTVRAFGTAHECGHRGVAELVYPSGRREGRCERHAHDNERTIAASPVAWRGHRVEWLERPTTGRVVESGAGAPQGDSRAAAIAVAAVPVETVDEASPSPAGSGDGSR